MQADMFADKESKDQLLRLRAAAMSIHLHTGPTRSMMPLLGQRARPLSFQEAVDALARGSGPEAQRLRKRAAATLKRARDRAPATRDGFIASCEHAHKRLSEPEHGHAIEPPSTPLGESLLASAKPRLNVVQGCQVIDEQVTADFDPHTFITSIRVTARVNRPPSDMFSSADPQNWSKLAPDSFRAAYRVADEHDLPKADGPRNYVPFPDPQIGKPWRGHFLEEVEFSWDGFELSTFRNLLNISYAPTPTKIEMRFDLYRAIDCTVGVRQLDGGLDVDSGYLVAEVDGEDPRWTKMDALKRVRFRDLTPDDSRFMEPGGSGQFLNFMSPAIVGIFMDQFVSEGTCIHPGS